MSAERHPLVDGLKVVAAQLIVWHHLAAYGPLSDAMAVSAPEITGWLYDHARKAVQVFLVVGGFLAAGVLLRGGTLGGLAATLWRRYARLVPPFLAAMALATGVALLLHAWLPPELQVTSTAPGVWLAHALLLFDVLDLPSFSAGAWYVAIDFQLHALLATLGWLAAWLAPQQPRRWALAGLMVLMGVSLLYANRIETLDAWALYFAGSCGLGVLAAQAQTGGRHRWLWGLAIAAFGLTALTVEWRDRIAVSVFVALLLALTARPAPKTTALTRWLAAAADRSYALFLTHYSVVLVGNAALVAWPALGAHGWAVASGCWLASLVLALAFYRGVEQPLAHWRPTPGRSG